MASDSAPVASAVPTLAKPVKTLLGEMALLHPFWVAPKAVGVFGEAVPRRMGLRRMGRTDGLSDCHVYSNDSIHLILYDINVA